MTDKKIEKLLKEQSEKIGKEVKRHMDVLIEHTDGKIDLIGEQYETIIERLDNHDDKFVAIENRLDSMDNRLDNMDGRLDNMDGRLDNMDGNIEIIKTDIEIIKNDLTQKVDRNEFVILERRVCLLETKRK